MMGHHRLLQSNHFTLHFWILKPRNLTRRFFMAMCYMVITNGTETKKFKINEHSSNKQVI